MEKETESLWYCTRDTLTVSVLPLHLRADPIILPVGEEGNWSISVD